MKRRLLLTLGMFCFYVNAFSQSDAMKCDSMKCCGMNVDINPAAVISGHQHSAGMWMFSYSYMNSSLQSNFSGTTKVSDQSIFGKYIMSPGPMRMDMHMLMGMYGVSDKLSLMAMFNYVSMKMDMKMLSSQMNMNNMTGMSSSTMTSTSHGLGDTKVSGIYRLRSANGHFLIADVGLSIPSGSINKTEKNNIELYGNKNAYMMQTGSGTLDFLPGITYLYCRNAYAVGVQATSAIHPFYNRQGYKLGDEFAVSSWYAYEWKRATSVSFRLNYNSTAQIQGSDIGISAPLEPANDTKNYGGTSLKGFIGITHSFQNGSLKNHKIAAEFGIPVYQNFNGIQTATNYNLIISWTLTL